MPAFMQGMCPFGENCWFTHPIVQMANLDWSSGQVPVQGPGVSSNPHVQMCLLPVCINKHPIDYTALASLPKSSINQVMMPQSPIAQGNMFHPHSCMAYPKQPYMTFKGDPMSNLSNAGSYNWMLPASNSHLNFFLLSRVVLQSCEGVVRGHVVLQLVMYADKFFVSYESLLVTYKIIFGENKNCQVIIVCRCVRNL